MGAEPVASRGDGRIRERRGERRVVPGPCERQEIGGDRTPEELVAEVDAVVADHHEAVLDGLVEARGEIGVEIARLLAAGRRRPLRVARGPRTLDPLKLRIDGGEPVASERPAGRGQQAQHSPAGIRAPRESRDHQVLERAGERAALQLASGGNELLGDERAAARSLGHQHEDPGGWPLALDPFDESRQLVPVQRTHHDPVGTARPLGDPGEVGPEGVAAREVVRLPGGDQAEPPLLGGAGQERDELARRSISLVKVLDDEHDRLAVTEPPERSQQPLQHAILAPLRRGGRRTGRKHAQPGRPIAQAGHDAHDVLRAGGQDSRQRVVIERQQGRLDGPDQRRVRAIGAGRAGTPAEQAEGLRKAGHPDASLVEEARNAKPAAALHEHGPGPAVSNGVERRRHAGERSLSPHEARAREPDGHGPF